MRLLIPGYKSKRRVFSLALDSPTLDDLNSEGVETVFVNDDSITIYPDGGLIPCEGKLIDTLSACNNYDVFAFFEDGTAIRYYDDSSSDTTLFITGQCNSNCIMCPSPNLSRKEYDVNDIDLLIEVIGHIPKDTPHMTITGGEPFMVGKGIFDLIEACKRKFTETDFLILTNGRVFAVSEYCRMLHETIPNKCLIGIPLHGSCADIHDSITQANGSFDQTLLGLKRLQALGVSTEIRIVVSRLNLGDLENTAKLISSELASVTHVTFVAMEMTGSAQINAEQVWISYKESFPAVRRAIDILVECGIDVRIYNYPICTVDPDMRMLCCKSISDYKVRFSKECEKCNEKESCSGVFAGTLNREVDELRAII